jgi:hypothetical protein
MIIVFIGGRNSGKTLSMTIEGYKKYKQGYKIYSNYHLNFPYTPYTVDDLLAFAESGMYFGNTIFLIDEAHIYFDSYSKGKRNMIFSYFLNQSSKNDIDVYLTTQFARQIFIRIRLNTEVVVESMSKVVLWKTVNSKPVLLENYRKKPNDYKVKVYVYNSIIKFSDTGQDKIVKRMYKANKYFPLYDTREVIKQQKDVFQRAKDDDKRNKRDDVHIPEKISYKEKRNQQHKNRLQNESFRKKLEKELGRPVL